MTNKHNSNADLMTAWQTAAGQLPLDVAARQLTADTITDDQIRTLQSEASDAGDDKQEDLCRLALGMTPIKAWNLTPYAARIRCADAINNARAQVDAS